MFVETFLESKNEDCLVQVLSFLTCTELATAALVTKTLHRTIFEDDKEENHVNTIWKGAEQALTNRADRQDTFQSIRRSFGSNAREHCRLFVHASKAAMAFESSDGVAENRMNVAHVLANLLNVREYDIESVIEKLKIGVKETKTIEEAASECEIGRMTLVSEAAKEDRERERKKEELQLQEKWKKIAGLTPPEKSNYHEIFVRITVASTGEVVSQGFCHYDQKHPWFAGLEMQRDYPYPGFNQGLQIFLNFQSLEQSEAMQSFQQFYLGDVSSESARPSVKSEFILTAVAIDTLDYSVSCLFQHGQENPEYNIERSYPAFGRLRGMHSYNFNLNARWGHDCFQLGSSILEDRHFLSYSLSLNIMASEDGKCLFLPSLDVDIEQDKSVTNLAIQRHLESSAPPGAMVTRGGSSNFPWFCTTSSYKIN